MAVIDEFTFKKILFMLGKILGIVACFSFGFLAFYYAPWLIVLIILLAFFFIIYFDKSSELSFATKAIEHLYEFLRIFLITLPWTFLLLMCKLHGIIATLIFLISCVILVLLMYAYVYPLTSVEQMKCYLGPFSILFVVLYCSCYFLFEFSITHSSLLSVLITVVVFFLFVFRFFVYLWNKIKKIGYVYFGCYLIFFVVLFCLNYLVVQISLANSCLSTVIIVTIFYLLLLNDTVTRKCLTLLNSVKAKMRIILALCLISAASGLLIINNYDYLMNFVSKSLNCCVNFFKKCLSCLCIFITS